MKLNTRLYLVPGLKITAAISVGKLVPLPQSRSGQTRFCFSLEGCPVGGVSGRVSVPNLPEPPPSLFSQLTVRNQSRVSFGVTETANLLWCSHLISSGHFFTTLNVIRNVLLFSVSRMELCLTTSATFLKSIRFKFLSRDTLSWPS